MSESINENLPEKLRSLIETLDIASVLTEPLTASIVSLLEMSSAELRAEGGSVLIREGDGGGLRFLAATGSVAQKLLNVRIPAGKGIAGFVLSTGQPMAVADVGEEEAFYRKVDEETGFSTGMILATPLRNKSEVIGVLEYVNRRSSAEQQPFTPNEMDRAAEFAEPIASLVHAYDAARTLRDLGNRVLAEGADLDLVMVREWLAGVRGSVEHHAMIELAVLIRDISRKGESESRLCREILEAVIRFSDRTSDTSYLTL